jgi:flagellar protein FliS
MGFFSDPAAMHDRYLAEAVETATPAERLLMLFDRLEVDLVRASTAFDTGDNYVINEQLVNAQEIVAALRATLDVATWPEGASLVGLYNLWQQELLAANLEKDPSRLPPVAEMVGQVAAAWRAARDQTNRAAALAAS